MNTPLTDLIEKIETCQKFMIDKVPDAGVAVIAAYEVCIEFAESLLPKEKQIIMDAFVAGSERGTKDVPFNCEQYFNQTFNQK